MVVVKLNQVQKAAHSNLVASKELKNYIIKNSCRLWTVDSYFFVPFFLSMYTRTATINIAAFMIIINSSYVLIVDHLLPEMEATQQ